MQTGRRIGAALWWCWLSVFCGTCAVAQISPGPLSSAHAHLEGPAQCSSCHSFGSKAPQFKCLNCHVEIAQRLTAKAGYHARVVKPGPAEDCVRCHTEHAGRNFQLVRWDKPVQQFDHRQTGYALEGKHAALQCAQCHTGQHIPPANRPQIAIKKLDRSFLGLSTQCTSCHEDEHHGQLGAECSQCHSPQGWKPASFNHNSTRFPLSGLHTRVVCQQCHRSVSDKSNPAAKPYVQYAGVPFSVCTDCHKDPHQGAFQNPCQSCHSVNGWKQLTSTSSFDHNLTKYPLVDLHANLDCFKCHKNSNFSEAIPHNRCSDCHAPDPHKGQFGEQDCAECHDVKGFKMTSFDMTRHQQSRYPLLGKHAALACEKCHAPAGVNTVYKVKFDACVDCHKDAHPNQFSAAESANRCDSCHTVNGFHPSTFTMARHQKTKFQLLGGHAATPCAECHKPDSGVRLITVASVSKVQYHFDSIACATCHQDPHAGQFQHTALEKCESCHTIRSWNDVTAFDHDTTKYKLTGAHRSVACLDCHRAPNFAKGVRNVTFRDAPQQCANCHEDTHGGQFTKDSKPADCTSCHVLAAWKPAMFDHQKQSDYPLDGAHIAVACQACHTQHSMINGRDTILYKGTPKRCSDCHAGR